MRKILVVDDEPKFQKALRINFRHQIKQGEWEFEFANNGEEALNIAKKFPEISLIITDLNMPGMDGLALLENLKKINANLNAIVITGYNTTENMRQAFRIGATDFIPKSTTLDELKTSIESALAIKTINVTATPIIEQDKEKDIKLNRQKLARKARAEERKVVKKSTLTSLARKLPKRLLYEAVAEIIEQNFSTEDIEDLEEELSQFRVLVSDREKDQEFIEEQDFKRKLKGEIPLSILIEGYVEERWPSIKGRRYGPYYYIRFYEKDTGKLGSYYVGKTDPRPKMEELKLLHERHPEAVIELGKPKPPIKTPGMPAPKAETLISKKLIARKASKQIAESKPSVLPSETEAKTPEPTEPTPAKSEKRQGKRIDLSRIRLG